MAKNWSNSKILNLGSCQLLPKQLASPFKTPYQLNPRFLPPLPQVSIVFLHSLTPSPPSVITTEVKRRSCQSNTQLSLSLLCLSHLCLSPSLLISGRAVRMVQGCFPFIQLCFVFECLHLCVLLVISLVSLAYSKTDVGQWSLAHIQISCTCPLN